MSTNDPDDLPLLDEEAIDELRDIMEDDFADLVETFLSDLPGQLAAIDEATAQGNADRLYRSAHKLKSGSGSIGALRLAQSAKRLELLARNGDLAPAPAALEAVQTTAESTQAALRGLL